MQSAPKRLVPGTLAALFLLALTPALPAQEGTGQEAATDVNEIIRVDVKAGQGNAFEEGVKRYMEDLQALGADWTWHAWEVLTGKHTGSYYVGTFDHSWADFDEQSLDDPEAAQQSYQDNLAPHVENAHTGFWRTSSDLSRQDPEAGGEQPTLSTVTFYKVKLGKGDAFANAVQRVKQAADGADHPEYWITYRLQFGGGPVWVIASGAESWADLAAPETGLDEVLEEATSEYEADAIWEQFTGSVEAVRSEIFHYREDLSLNTGSGSEQ